MLTVEQSTNLLNLVESLAKECQSKRSLSDFLLLLSKKFPSQNKKILQVITKENADLVSIIRQERTGYLARVKIPPAERIIICQIFLEHKELKTPEEFNELFIKSKLSYRFPDSANIKNFALFLEKIYLLTDVLFIILSIGKLDQINDIKAYISKFIQSSPEQIKKTIDYLDSVYQFVLDNILDLDLVKKQCLDTLKSFGHLVNVYQDKDIEELATMVFHERKAAEVAFLIKNETDSNTELSDNTIVDSIAMNLVQYEI